VYISRGPDGRGVDVARYGLNSACAAPSQMTDIRGYCLKRLGCTLAVNKLSTNSV
jgi:hypothetical protein